MTNERACVVLHYVVTWLNVTEFWLYTQIKSLPPRIRSEVLAERERLAEAFPLSKLHSLAAEPAYRRFQDRIVRRFGFRHHLAFAARTAADSHSQILHSHFGHVGWANSGLAGRCGLRHVVSFYGTDATRLPHLDNRWRTRYRELFAAADCILCEGPHMAATLKSLGCPEQKLAIQHLGVNVEELPFRERRRDHHEPLRILMVGSFREKKGIPDGLRALALLHKDGVNVEATLIGDATAERRCVREKQRIFETLRDAGMELRVRLLGFQSHERMIEEAYRHHIFLSPSKTAGDGDAEGGAPVTLIEMAATGMPIVSTRHCDIPSIVNDGVTGLLAEEGDVHGLHMRLAELSDHPDRWGTMGAAGRHVVEERFNAAKLGPQLAGIYETFL